MEESLFLLDDFSKRDKYMMVEMLKTEDKFTKRLIKENDEINERKIFNDILHTSNTLKQKTDKMTRPKMSVHDAIDFLISLQKEISQNDENDQEINQEVIAQLKKEMSNLQNDLTEGDSSILLTGLAIDDGELDVGFNSFDLCPCKHFFLCAFFLGAEADLRLTLLKIL